MQVLDVFKSRLGNARKQASDLINDKSLNNTDDNEEIALGMTLGELWGTAKYQFSKAKEAASMLTDKEEINKANDELERFRKEFSDHLFRLEIIKGSRKLLGKALDKKVFVVNQRFDGRLIDSEYGKLAHIMDNIIILEFTMGDVSLPFDNGSDKILKVYDHTGKIIYDNEDFREL